MKILFNGIQHYQGRILLFVIIPIEGVGKVISLINLLRWMTFVQREKVITILIPHHNLPRRAETYRPVLGL
jgi:hypothetical protein